MMEHTLAAQPTHSVWDRSLEPRLHIESGDEVQIECIDSSGSQVHPGMTVAEFLTIDRTRIHALTGPIWINGAEPGDVLEIEVLSTRHSGWGWSSVIRDSAFSKIVFASPTFSIGSSMAKPPVQCLPQSCPCGPSSASWA